MFNNYNLNKFDTLMTQASDAILCNSECKQQKQTENLKQNYLNAQTNLASATNQIKTAQKNYITFTQGTSAYNELFDKQLQEKAQLIAQNFTKNFNEETIKINSKIDTYNGLIINFKNIFDLFRKYKNENIELLKELKEETNDVLTNERKTYYQDQNIDKLKFYYYYLFLIIYVICVLCFVAFSLIYVSHTNWKLNLGLLVVFIVLPFFSTWILALIISLLYKLYELLPNNVYNKKNY